MISISMHDSLVLSGILALCAFEQTSTGHSKAVYRIPGLLLYCLFHILCSLVHGIFKCFCHRRLFDLPHWPALTDFVFRTLVIDAQPHLARIADLERQVQNRSDDIKSLEAQLNEDLIYAARLQHHLTQAKRSNTALTARTAELERKLRALEASKRETWLRHVKAAVILFGVSKRLNDKLVGTSEYARSLESRLENALELYRSEQLNSIQLQARYGHVEKELGVQCEKVALYEATAEAWRAQNAQSVDAREKAAKSFVANRIRTKQKYFRELKRSSLAIFALWLFSRLLAGRLKEETDRSLGLEKMIDSSRIELEQLRSRAEEERDKIRQLLSQTEDTFEEEREQQRAELQAAETQCKEKEETISALRLAHDKVHADYAALRRLNEDVSQQLKHEKSENGAKAKKIEGLIGSLAAMTESNRIEKKRLEGVITRVGEDGRAKDVAIKKLTNDLEETRAQLGVSKVGWEGEKGKWILERKTKEKEIGELRKRLENADSAKTKLEEELVAQEVERAKLTSVSTERQENNHTLEGEIGELRKRLEKAESANSKFEEELAANETERAELAKVVAESQEQGHALNHETDQLRKQLKETESAKLKLEEELTLKEAETTGLARVSRERQEKNHTLEEDVTRLAKEAEKLKEETERLRSDAADDGEERARLEKQVEQLTGELEERMQGAERLKQLLGDKEQALAQVRDSNATLTEEKEWALKERGMSKQQVEDLANRYDGLISAHAELVVRFEKAVGDVEVERRTWGVGMACAAKAASQGRRVITAGRKVAVEERKVRERLEGELDDLKREMEELKRREYVDQQVETEVLFSAGGRVENGNDVRTANISPANTGEQWSSFRTPLGVGRSEGCPLGNRASFPPGPRSRSGSWSGPASPFGPPFSPPRTSFGGMGQPCSARRSPYETPSPPARRKFSVSLDSSSYSPRGGFPGAERSPSRSPVRPGMPSSLDDCSALRRVSTSPFRASSLTGPGLGSGEWHSYPRSPDYSPDGRLPRAHGLPQRSFSGGSPHGLTSKHLALLEDVDKSIRSGSPGGSRAGPSRSSFPLDLREQSPALSKSGAEVFPELAPSLRTLRLPPSTSPNGSLNINQNENGSQGQAAETYPGSPKSDLNVAAPVFVPTSNKEDVKGADYVERPRSRDSSSKIPVLKKEVGDTV